MRRRRRRPAPWAWREVQQLTTELVFPHFCWRKDRPGRVQAARELIKARWPCTSGQRAVSGLVMLCALGGWLWLPPQHFRSFHQSQLATTQALHLFLGQGLEGKKGSRVQPKSLKPAAKNLAALMPPPTHAGTFRQHQLQKPQLLFSQVLHLGGSVSEPRPIPTLASPS